MCIKNPKRFLFWKYYGDCKYKVVRFGRCIIGSGQLIAKLECMMCGRQIKSQFISEDTLLEMGVSTETIIEHRDKMF